METNYYESKIFNDLVMTDSQLENCKFVDCIFEACRFENITLTNCSFHGCTFNKTTIINPSSNYSDINNLNFSHCNLISIPWGIFVAHRKHTRIFNKMNNSFLKYNSFIDLILNKQDFSTNHFSNAVFEECELKEAQFNNCDFDESQFIHCDLRKADFRDATQFIIAPSVNDLKGARFSYHNAITLLEQMGIVID